jgi:hypothetical protein
MPWTIPWTILADGTVAVLLIATLIYVRRLSVRLEAIRAGRAEFEKLVADFTRTTDQASSHLHQIKAVADTSLQDLQARIERTQGLTTEFGKLGDDLKLLTERAEGAADRLDSTIGRARFLTAANAPAAAPVKVQTVPLQAVAQSVGARLMAVNRAIDEESDKAAAHLSALSGLR